MEQSLLIRPWHRDNVTALTSRAEWLRSVCYVLSPCFFPSQTAGHWPRIWNRVRSPDTPTQESYHANMSRWLVGKSIPTPNGKEYVEIYLHDPYAILLAWREVEPSLSVTRLTAKQLLKLWRPRLGCQSSRFISRLWYKHLLSEDWQCEWLFPAGSPEYVRSLLLLRSTWSRQAQPPKCPEFLNPERRIWSKTCQWLYTIHRNTLTLHTNLVPIVELHSSHRHFSTVVPSTRRPSERHRINT